MHQLVHDLKKGCIDESAEKASVVEHASYADDQGFISPKPPLYQNILARKKSEIKSKAAGSSSFQSS